MTSVFISHGHNETVRFKLRVFVKDRLELEPVILAEQPDLGLTVIQKLERYGRSCDFALIVLTADDRTGSGGARARQNVIHELGFFHGILGRDRVLLLKQAGVELFSNISGLIYKEFDGENIESVFEDIRRALESGSAQRAGTSVPPEQIQGISAEVVRNLQQLFRSPEKVYVVPSYEYSEGRTNIRDADARVATEIGSLTQTKLSDDGLRFSFNYPAFPLVILGSTRYNALAEALQREIDLPYQFVGSRHSTLPRKRLSVLTEFGEEFVASQDQCSMDDGTDYDYGVFLVATLNTGKKLFWIAGIHSPGTDGVWKYIEENSSEAPGWLPSRPEEFTALLVRVHFKLEGEGNKKRADILGVEALGAPRRALLKVRRSPAPQAVLCDLGDVLMYFDRTRTYRAIAHYAPTHSWGDVQNKLENQRLELRDRYESGQMDTEAFCDELYLVLDLDEKTLPRPLLKEFWSDIFWLNKEMADALKYLHLNGTHLVLFSNTNPLHFQGIERDYPDLLQLFSARVLSYEVGSPKSKGPMFARAIDAVRSKVPGCPTAEMLVVDDTAEHVNAARGFGMKALQYQSYPHFVWWARAQGLYVP